MAASATSEPAAEPADDAPAVGVDELGRRLRLIARAAGIGYWALTDDAVRAVWSEELRALHGLAAGEPVPLFGDWLRQHVHPEDREPAARAWAHWVSSGVDHLEHSFRLRDGNGEWHDLLLQATVDRSGPNLVRFGMLIDVTEKRKIEQALRAANERAALARRGASIGTWELDLESGHVLWDDTMWALRGREPQALPPSRNERLSWVHPDDRANTFRENAAAEADVLPHSHEFRVVLPSGQVRWLRSYSAVMQDDHGRPVRRIGVNLDTTASREAEAARQERAMAQRESEAKSRFLSRMSHELRTPLNAVVGFAQLMLADEAGHDGPGDQRRQRLGHLLSAAQHLQSLVDDVLDLTTLEGGEMQVSIAPLELGAVVAETLPLVESLRQKMGVRVALGPLDAVVLGDRMRLRQVLLNLLSNAIKFNRPDGWVELGVEPGSDPVLIRVSDSGRGMSLSQLEHLFEPFNRLGVESDAIDGSGIGLTIVKTLVERMGGSIGAHSRPGVGSVFELRLPAAPRPPAGSASGPASQPPAPVPLPAAAPAASGVSTILYIEDNAVNVLIVEQLILRRPDLHLQVAHNGAQGAQVAADLQPALILLDMQLPDIDGLEVLRRLRVNPRTAAIPCIALSANAMQSDIDHALRAGLSDYWTKPLDFNRFMDSMTRFFGPAPQA